MNYCNIFNKSQQTRSDFSLNGYLVPKSPEGGNSIPEGGIPIIMVDRQSNKCISTLRVDVKN